MKRDSDSFPPSRRWMLRALGSAGVVGLAGCVDDDDGSEPGESTTSTGTTAPEPTTSAESGSASVEETVDRWLAEPLETLQVSAYSPSALYEAYDVTLFEKIQRSYYYSVYEFGVHEVPLSFVQATARGFALACRVDQLPADVSESDVKQQLRNGEFSKEADIGDFEIFNGTDYGGNPRAVGQGKHVLTWPIRRGGTSDPDLEGYLVQVLRQINEDDYDPASAKEVMGVLDVNDVITISDASGKMVNAPVDSETGAVSVDIEGGEKYGAWAFENEEKAAEAYETLQENDLWGGFESVENEREYVLADGSYSIEELGSRDISIPVGKVLIAHPYI